MPINLEKYKLSRSDLNKYKINKEPEKSGLRKFGDALIESEKNFGESIAGTLGINYAQKLQKPLEKNQQVLFDNVMKKLKDPLLPKKRKQLYIDKLKESNPDLISKIPELQKIMDKSTKQILGEAAGVAIDVLGAGSLQRKGTQLLNPATKSLGFLKGSYQGLKTGAKGGALFGSATGVARSAQEDDSLGQMITEGVVGGVVGGLTGGIIGGVTGGIGGRLNRKKEITEMLNETRPTGEAVKFKRIPVVGEQDTVKIKITKDKEAQKAISMGIDETDVQFIKNSSQGDKAKYRKMYGIAEMVSKDKTVTKRPIEQAGSTLLRVVRFVDNKRKNVGQKLGDTVKKMSPKPININNIYDDFIDDLSDSGISIKSGGRLDFRASRYANTQTIQKQIQTIYNSIKPNTAGNILRTPQRINRIRQIIFEDLNLAKQSNELSNTAEGMLNKVRKNLEKPLIEQSKIYKDLSTQYAKSTTALTKFNKVIGRDVNINSDIASLRAGEVMNRILGNASAKPTAIIKEIESVATDLGYKNLFKESIRNQVLFADFLEDLFGTTQTRSLRGQVSKGAVDAEEAIMAANDATKGNLFSLLRRGYNLARLRTPENQQKAVKNLIGL